MTNNMLFEILLKNDNLKELSYANEILTYQDKSINVSDVYLHEFFNNPYSQLNTDQYIISSQDFFNIMAIHYKKIESYLNKELKPLSELEIIANNILEKYGKAIKKSDTENNYDIINSKHYFELLSNELLTAEDLKLIQDYEEYILELNTYNDYLLHNQKNELLNYRFEITNLLELEQTDQIKLNQHQKDAIDKYNSIINNTNNLSNYKTRKIVKENNEVSHGFINAFVVVLLMILTGIIIGCCGFFFAI